MNKLSKELMAEFFATAVLVLLGVGVVTNVGLGPRGNFWGVNWVTVNLGWCFAVVVAAMMAAGVSGAHLNPAVTFAMAVKRGFPWFKVLPYWAAQTAGAFVGALGVFLTYRDGLVSAGMPNVWTGGPGTVWDAAFSATANAVGNYSIFTAGFAEFIGTAVLLWGILAAFDSKNYGVGSNLGVLFVGFAVLAVGASLGGPSGYMINPARDLGPRIFGTLVGTKNLFGADFWWLLGPWVGCLLGGVFGIFTYDIFITPGLKKE